MVTASARNGEGKRGDGRVASEGERRGTETTTCGATTGLNPNAREDERRGRLEFLGVSSV